MRIRPVLPRLVLNYLLPALAILAGAMATWLLYSGIDIPGGAWIRGLMAHGALAELSPAALVATLILLATILVGASRTPWRAALGRWCLVLLTLAALTWFTKRAEIALVHAGLVPGADAFAASALVDTLRLAASAVVVVGLLVVTGRAAGKRWLTAAVTPSGGREARRIIVQSVSAAEADQDLLDLLRGERSARERFAPLAQALETDGSPGSGWVDLLTQPFDRVEVRLEAASHPRKGDDRWRRAEAMLRNAQFLQNLRALRPHLVEKMPCKLRLRGRDLLVILVASQEAAGIRRSSDDPAASAAAQLQLVLEHLVTFLSAETGTTAPFRILVARPDCATGKPLDDYGGAKQALDEVLKLLDPSTARWRAPDDGNYRRAWSELLGAACKPECCYKPDEDSRERAEKGPALLDELAPKPVAAFVGTAKWQRFDPQAHLCVDVSSGQRIFAIVAAVMTMNTRALFSYVPPATQGGRTRGEADVLVFDGEIGLHNPAQVAGA